MTKAILAPAAILVLWTLVMLVIMAVRRLSGVQAIPRETLRQLPRVGGRGQDLDPVLGKAAWPSHNYSHLLEQPTLFYATVAILALTGAADQAGVWIAWAYVAARIAHSLWQITVNTIPVRFSLFVVSTICLVALGLMAARATLT